MKTDTMTDTNNTPNETKTEDQDELDTGAPKNPESEAAHEAGTADNSGEDAPETGERHPADIIASLTAEMDGLREDKLRALADAQNTRRRAEKEIADARAYSVSSFAKDLLDVADSLTRAVEAVKAEDLDQASDPIRNLVEGIKMTEKALISKMERHGVKKIDPAPGDNFNPHIHQAVAQIPSEHPNGKIAAVMQTGYVIGERTLRAAMVAVSAGGEAGGDAGGGVDVTA